MSQSPDVARDASRAVLGACLADPAAIPRARAVLDGDPAVWPSATDAAVWRAVCDLADEGAAPDLLTVCDRLHGEAGVQASYIASLLDGVPDCANVEHYAGIVAGDHRQRQLRRLGTLLQENPSPDALEAVRAQIERLSAPRRSPLESRWRSVELQALTEPPPARRWLFRRQDGEGLLPLGRVGLLGAAGGTGKTQALVDAAVSIASRNPWLGCLPVGEDVTGRVLLLLGEEEPEEIDRRLYRATRGLGEHQLQAVAERVVAVPLAGVPVALTQEVSGRLTETPMLSELRRRLEDGGPWSLVVVDPLSRFGGGEIEANNEAATRFLQALESLTEVPGTPTVLVATHSSKLSRRSGGADVRGVTGLTDAARWVATLTTEGDAVKFEQTKSNYSMPMAKPIKLTWRDGVLVALTPEEIEAAAVAEGDAQQRNLDDDVAAVVEALRREGTLSSKDAIARAAGIRLMAGRTAVDLAIARGLIEQHGTSRRRTFIAAETVGCVCVSPPTPPHDVRDVDGRGRPSRDAVGTSGTSGTSIAAEEPF